MQDWVNLQKLVKFGHLARLVSALCSFYKQYDDILFPGNEDRTNLTTNFRKLIILDQLSLQTAELSKLKCWYETSQTHPYFIISPLKIEQISTNRRANARIIHGAIGEKRIATLLDVTKGEMKQANIKDFDTNVDSVSPKRTSIQVNTITN